MAGSSVTVTAVLFDLDDTLFDHWRVRGQRWQTCASSSPRSAVCRLVRSKRASAPARRPAPAGAGGRMTVDDARVERFRQLLVFAGGTASAGMRRPRRPSTARRTSRMAARGGALDLLETCTVACRRAS